MNILPPVLKKHGDISIDLKRIFKVSSILLLSSSLVACSVQLPSFSFSRNLKSGGTDSFLTGASKPDNKYSASGTIIISQRVPEKDGSSMVLARTESTRMAPLIGYFPPAGSYNPADNESWLEIERKSKTITLYKGANAVKQLSAEGEIKIGPGEFYLQHKQSEPLWYAPDLYFQKRKLATPKPGDRLRYRRGALGKLALYPTTTFPIHCGPVWNDDVGGLRLSTQELTAIYEALPVGAAIVVK